MKEMRIVGGLFVAAVIASTGTITTSAAPVGVKPVTINDNATASAKKVTNNVYLYKITHKSVATGKSVTVKTNIKRSGKTKLIKNVITVKNGKKYVAKDRTSVKLKSGKYSVVSNVQYKVLNGKKWSKTHSKTLKQNLTVSTKTVKKATAKVNLNNPNDKRAWVNSIPKVCKSVPVKVLKINKSKYKGWNGRATANFSNNKMWYEIYITGSLKPSEAPAIALMKHECGHILQFRYAMKNGFKKYNDFEKTAYKKKNGVPAVEQFADCISDALGAKRLGKNYKVGYGTVCTTSQKNLAKKIIKLTT